MIKLYIEGDGIRETVRLPSPTEFAIKAISEKAARIKELELALEEANRIGESLRKVLSKVLQKYDLKN